MEERSVWVKLWKKRNRTAVKEEPHDVEELFSCSGLRTFFSRQWGEERVPIFLGWPIFYILLHHTGFFPADFDSDFSASYLAFWLVISIPRCCIVNETALN